MSNEKRSRGEPNLLAKLFCPLQGLFQRKLVSVALCGALQDLNTAKIVTLFIFFLTMHNSSKHQFFHKEERTDTNEQDDPLF